MSTALLVIAGVLVLAVIVVIAYYNGFIAKRNMADNAFATIDVMLKKRCDLIPNLVATVKEYMQHEQQTFARIAELRSRAMEAKTPDEAVAAHRDLGAAVRSLMVQVEQYPQLKANENFMLLQRSLNEIEEQLSAARRTFNAAVTEWNNSVQMFPGNILAGVFGFAGRSLLETSADDRKNPDVKSLFK